MYKDLKTIIAIAKGSSRTMEDFACDCGVSSSTLYRMASGHIKRRPKEKVITAIIDHAETVIKREDVDIAVDDIITSDDDTIHSKRRIGSLDSTCLQIKSIEEEIKKAVYSYYIEHENCLQSGNSPNKDDIYDFTLTIDGCLTGFRALIFESGMLYNELLRAMGEVYIHGTGGCVPCFVVYCDDTKEFDLAVDKLTSFKTEASPIIQTNVLILGRSEHALIDIPCD